MLRKFKKPLSPNTIETSPSKRRAIKVTIFATYAKKNFSFFQTTKSFAKRSLKIASS